MRYTNIYQYMGDPVSIINPLSYATAGVACSNEDGLALLGVDQVLCILAYDTIEEGVTLTVSLYYSCDAEGSNANATSTIWHSTDAVFVAITTASTDNCAVLRLNCRSKNLPISGENGYLFAATGTLAAASQELSLVAIPFYANKTLPCTNAITIVDAYGDPDT